MRHYITRTAIYIFAIYLTIGLLYIFLSDRLAKGFFPDMAQYMIVQNYKGYAFIFVSGLIITCLINRSVKKRNNAIAFLEQSNKLYQTLLAGLPQTDICFFDKDMRYIFVTGNLMKKFGLPANGFKGKTIDETLIDTDTKAFLKTNYIKTLKGKEITEELVFENTYIELKGIPVYNKVNEIIGGIVTLTNISEHKAQLYEIADRERYYRSMIESVNDLIYTLNSEGCFTYISANLKEMLGYEANEIIGQNARPLIHPDDAELCFAFLAEVITTRTKKGGIEYRVLHKNGSWRWHLSNGAPLIDEQGSVSGYVGIARDITERRQTEIELREREIFIRTVLDNLPIGVALNKLNEGTATYMNKRFEEIYGWPGEDLMDVSAFFEKVYPDEAYRKNVVQQIMDDINSGDPSKMHWENITVTANDGTERIINAVNIPLFDQNTMVSTVIDVTPLKLAEQNILSMQQRLLRAEQVANFGNWELNLKTKIINVSDGAMSIYGYTKNVITFTEGLNIIIEEYRNKVNDSLKRLIEYGETYNERFTILRQTDRQIRHIHSVATYDKKRQIVFGIVHDVTELESIERELQQKNEKYIALNNELKDSIIKIQSMFTQLEEAKNKAEENDRLKTAFLNNMSHEIRTPMNGILGFSDLLAQEDLSIQKREKYKKIIRSSGEQLINIIDDILDISRLEAGAVSLYPENFELNQLINVVVAWAENQIIERNKKIKLNVHKHLKDGSDTLYADKSRMLQILSNLVTNAVKYTNAGYIDIGYILVEAGIELHVKDTGMGIPFEKQTEIFERFIQTEETRKNASGGVGIGLSIVKGLTNLMGGKVSVTSEQGVGSEFIVFIPLTPVKTNIMLSENIVKSSPPNNKTILVVEDIQSGFDLLQEYLADTSIKLIHAQSGAEAIEKAFLMHELDLILMDIRMPGMDGFEATKAIKRTRPNIPIIAQTAYAMQNDKEQAFAAGFSDYITKPIDKNTLLTILKKYLQ